MGRWHIQYSIHRDIAIWFLLTLPFKEQVYNNFISSDMYIRQHSPQKVGPLHDWPSWLVYTSLSVSRGDGLPSHYRSCLAITQVVKRKFKSRLMLTDKIISNMWLTKSVFPLIYMMHSLQLLQIERKLWLSNVKVHLNNQLHSVALFNDTGMKQTCV